MRAHKLDIFDSSSNTLTVDELTLNGRSVTDFSEVSSIKTNVRQTYLSGPDLIGVDATSTVETAATKTGDLRSTYHDLGVDMLTGSRGGMVIEKSKGVDAPIIQSSLLPNTRSRLVTSGTDAVADAINRLQQFLSSGVQFGSDTDLASANLFAFQTTKREVIDGVLWEWNPESGFAQWRYTGTGVAFNLKHPMGAAPLLFAVKNMTDVVDWQVGLYNTDQYMRLNLTGVLSGPASTIWTGLHTDTYLSISSGNTVNGSGDDLFGFGWFGDPLDDLEVGMVGKRGVTASLVVPASGAVTIETGITEIQMVLYKSITSTSDWAILNKASGFTNYTILNDTDAETTQSALTVSGSQINWNGAANDYLILVIGSTADAPDNKLKTGTKVLRKVGTAATGHRVDLGPMAGGTAGGMVMARDVEAVNSNFVMDTINGDNNYLSTNSTAILNTYADLLQFASTGVTLGAGASFNSANINQLTAFLTTNQITMSDGSYWEYNPLTGFAMCKYTGDGVAGRTIDHPMGKKPRMMWIKPLTFVDNWRVYLDSLGADYQGILNSDGAFASGSTLWNSTEPDTDTITLGSNSAVNSSSEDFILYGWFGDDLSDIETGLTGERGVSAFYQYTGGSGVVSFDTGIDNIEAILYKESSGVDNWFYTTNIDGDGYSYYQLNTTSVEGSATDMTVEGSTITYNGNTYDVEFIVFGSKVDSGIVNDVTLPATISDPSIFSIANGFAIGGNNDEIVKIETSQTVNITGDSGKKFIILKTDGLMYFTSTRPTYERAFVPYANGIYTYDIDRAKLYNNGTPDPGVVIGECMLDSTGNVYDVRTYAKGDVWVSDWISWLAGTIYSFDLPFGNFEYETQIIGNYDNVYKQEVYYKDTSGLGWRGAIVSTVPDQEIMYLITSNYGGINGTLDNFKLIVKRTF